MLPITIFFSTWRKLGAKRHGTIFTLLARQLPKPRERKKLDGEMTTGYSCKPHRLHYQGHSRNKAMFTWYRAFHRPESIVETLILSKSIILMSTRTWNDRGWFGSLGQCRHLWNMVARHCTGSTISLCSFAPFLLVIKHLHWIGSTVFSSLRNVTNPKAYFFVLPPAQELFDLTCYLFPSLRAP